MGAPSYLSENAYLSARSYMTLEENRNASTKVTHHFLSLHNGVVTTCNKPHQFKENSL